MCKAIPVRLLTDSAITTAVTGSVAGTYGKPSGWARSLVLEADFTYGSGGTTAKAYVQTTLDGTDWFDIACFAFTTASGRKVGHVNLVDDAGTNPTATTDAALADDTVFNGAIGTDLRVKLTTTGTYAATTLSVRGLLKG